MIKLPKRNWETFIYLHPRYWTLPYIRRLGSEKDIIEIGIGGIVILWWNDASLVVFPPITIRVR